jgi:prepilin-type N-terminal cleavage/methylation domain-containing protein
MKNARGFSLIELLIVVVIIAIVAAIAIPNLLAARRSGNEASAVSSVRVLHGANMTYASSLGSGDFAGLDSTPGTSALAALGAAGLIDPVLSGGNKTNYLFTGDRTASSPLAPATFYFSANPATAAGVLQSGTRRFGISTDGLIKFDVTAANLSVPFDAATLASPIAVPLDN